MINKFLSLSILIILFYEIKSQLMSGPVVVKQISTTNAKGEFNLNVYSSLEGHALLLLSGNNLMNLKDYELSCFFQPFPTLVNANVLKSYKSIILKDKTSCPIDDFNCIYWSTSYQYTNQQIACYTPRVPENDRLPFANGLDYYLSLVFGDNVRITCSDINKCRVRFSSLITPIINFIDSSNFYAGFPITFRLKPTSNKLEQLINIKIGRYNCIPEIPEIYSDNYNDMIISCNTGDFQSDIIKNFLFNYMYGSAVLPFQLLKYQFYTNPINLDKESPYYFRIFPKIDKISQNQGFFSGGTVLTITGKGFKTDDIKVFIDNTECKDLKNISSTSITCTIQQTQIDPTKTDFFGSNGLRFKRYDLANSVSFDTLNQKINNSIVVPIYDDILLETSTKPGSGVNYGQYFNGFFKAPFSAKYRFWSTSDDQNQVFLTYALDGTINRTRNKIIDFNSWTNFEDFLNKIDIARSNWISLEANEYYPFEINHLQGVGLDHFRLGVEISEYGIDSKFDIVPNQINPIQYVNFNVKYARDLYEIPIETTNVNDVVKVGCMSLPPIEIKISDTPTTVYAKLKTLEVGAISFSFIIRKYSVNEKNKYFVTESEPVVDYSYSSSINWDKMYINLNTDVTLPQKTLEVENQGTKTGVSFLFFIDKKKSDRTFIY